MLNWDELLINPKLIRPGLLINGQLNFEGSHTSVTNPADGKTIANIINATSANIELAILTSWQEFALWKSRTAKERSICLRRWYDLMIDNVDDLAKIITLEAGKPLAEAKNEVLYAASYLEWFSEEAKRVYGDIIPANTLGQKALVLKQPIGVCAAITPWNFPSAMLTRKVAAALAAGCTMIARPSSQTPLSVLALGYLALEAGIPNGVFNIITGDSNLISQKLCASNTIRKLSFTGSTEVGMDLYRQSANSIKRLSLELGGNAPFIIFEDANLNSAIAGLIRSKFRNAGQTCVCANRVFVSRSIYDEFIKKLTPQVADLKVGNGLDTGIDIGPLINLSAKEHAQNLMEDALNLGANLVYGNTEHPLGGNFFMPTILGNCSTKMRVFNEEIFAPIIAIYTFDNDDEVVRLANDTPFGLASYFYTQNQQRIFNISENLEYGIVGVNSGTISAENVPFGGIKHSGFGREGSKYGLDDYIDTKYICLNVTT
jgi:succinate-semialdehyde dehydrogenase / glutarate-semialdehyde dehydrogenase